MERRKVLRQKIPERAAIPVLIALVSPGCYLFQKGLTERLEWTESTLGPEAIARKAEEADSLYRSPRAAEKVERSYGTALESVSRSNGYRGLWQAARAAVWLSENLPEKGREEEFARKGVMAAREAARVSPDSVEPHYYLALSLARFSDLKRSPRYVLEMAGSAEEALKRDERFDRAGPHRFLGLLNLRCEAHRMVTGYGDYEKALGHLRRALELFPEDGENRIALAEALIEDEDYEGARRELVAALASKPPQGLEAEHAAALDRARKIEEEIRGK